MSKVRFPQPVSVCPCNELTDNMNAISRHFIEEGIKHGKKVSVFVRSDKVTAEDAFFRFVYQVTYHPKRNQLTKIPCAPKWLYDLQKELQQEVLK